MTDKQPEALRLANVCSNLTRYSMDAHLIAAYLRSQHAELETLRAGYAAARLEIESLKSQLAERAKEHADELTVAYMCGASLEKERAAQAAPAAVAGPSDLRTRCDELLAWRKTGILPGETLRTLAREKYGDEYDAIQRAERDTETEALNFVIAAPQQDPAGWYVTGCGRLLDEHEAKTEAKHIGGTASSVPLYTTPQPSPAAQGDALDAGRWRRLVNASELSFPVATIADDPENGAVMLYGRKALEDFVDHMDEIPNTYDAARAAQECKSND